MLLPWKFQRAPALFGGNRLISALFSAPEACYEERFNEPMCTPPSAFSALVLNPQPFSANDLGSHGQFSEALPPPSAGLCRRRMGACIERGEDHTSWRTRYRPEILRKSRCPPERQCMQSVRERHKNWVELCYKLLHC